MDLQLLTRTIDFYRRRKKWLLLSALFGTSAYGAYRVYHSPSMTRKRKKVARSIGAVFSILDIVSDSAETMGVLSTDLKQFLSSDSDEIPNSFKQISKITESDQFHRSLTRVSEALSIGIMKGYRSQTKDDNQSSFTDQILDRVLSNAGNGFVSVVAASFAKNLVHEYFSRDTGDGDSSTMLDIVCNEKFKDMMVNWIQVFVSTAVAVYLDKTVDVNMYDELFAGLTNPKHETKVREALVSVCNGAVETLVKTSHQVLTNQPCCNGEFQRFYSTQNDFTSNRRFVLDMTGRVTFETLRSIAKFLVCKTLDGSRRGVNVARDQVVDRGKEVVRYFSTKSSVILAICIALYLHVVGRTRPSMFA